MVKITVDEDCGNAPKKQFIKDFLIANANADSKAVADMITDDIHLDIPGQASESGREPVKQLLLSEATKAKISELIIHNILSHGSRCAADGVLKFEDGREVSFCSMYVFNSHSKNARLKAITSYLVVR